MNRHFFIAILLLAANIQTTNAQKVVLHMAGNQTFEYSISQLDSITFVGEDLIIEEEHEWVDLGLPSGTLWATCNVGASSPEEYGDYFAWGETEPKSEYSWGTYMHCEGDYNTLTKYCYESECGYNGFTDKLTELLPEDDAATANWGNEWQMPSLAQLQELYDSEYTTKTEKNLNGVDGILIMSKCNDQTLFLPFAGNRNETSLNDIGRYGDYWSRSLNAYDSPYADALSFNGGRVWWDSYLYRYRGKTVRPVRTNDTNTNSNNKFCNLPARLIIENVLQAPVLFTSCESMGEYCTIKSDGQHFLFTDAAGNTDVIYITANSDCILGLSGLIIGKLSIPEIGEDRLRVVCFDCACPNCYQNYNITKPLVLQTTGYAKCNNCERTYNLNDCGNVSDGSAGRALYRYRVNYLEYTLIVNNG